MKYVLLLFVNEYGQEGGYFAGIFDSQKQAEESVDHIGRIDGEDFWFEVREVGPNKAYEDESFTQLHYGAR